VLRPSSVRARPYLHHRHRHHHHHHHFVMVYKCIHGLAPSYLTSHCKPISSCTGLRSAKSGQLNFPRTKTDYGNLGSEVSSFAVNGPVVWNTLRAELRSRDISLDVFKARLKTFLLNCLTADLAHLLYSILILRSTNVLNNNNNNNNNKTV